MFQRKKIHQSIARISSLCAFCFLLSMQVSFLQAQSSKPKPKAEEKPALVTAKNNVTAKKEELLITLDVAGIYEATAFDEIVLKPKQWKTLKSIKAVPHGSVVMEGDPILWLETKKLDKEIEKQQRAILSAELSLRLATDELRFLKESTAMDLERSDRLAKVAKEELDYFLKVREQRSLKSADLNLKYSRYSLEYTQEELNQLQQMYEADDLTEQTEEIILKRAKRAVQLAEFNLQSAELAHKRKLSVTLPREKETLIDTDARAALSREKSLASLPLLLRKKEMDVQKLQRAVEELNKKVTELGLDRESMTIYSDRSGFVYYGRCVKGKWSEISTLAKQLKPTGTVSINTVLMTIVDPKELQVRLALTESQLALAAAKQDVFLQANAIRNHSSQGKIVKLEQVQQSDGKFLAIASTKTNPDAPITPGMTCKVKIRVHQNKQAILLPVTMVHRDVFSEDKRPYVWLKKKVATKQFVETGYTHAGKVEILSGVDAGDVVYKKKP